MRFLKIAIAGLITAVAMFFSLMFALGVAAIGVAVYLFLRLRGKPTGVRFGAPIQPPPAGPATDDVIDVTATEVGKTRLEH